MVNRLLILLSCIIFSCSLPYDRVSGGWTRIPKPNFKFANKKYFDLVQYQKDIDCDYSYLRIESYQLDKINNTKLIFDSNYKSGLQFYENGCIRRIGSDLKDPNPKDEGQRGIVYYKKGKMYFDIFIGGANTVTSVYKHHVEIMGDKLIVTKKDLFYNDVTIYQKSEKLPEEYKKYEANW